jgi:hypothetical protein
MQHAHHAKVAPAFAKRYGKIGEAIQSALDQYRQEVPTLTRTCTSSEPLNAISYGAMYVCVTGGEWCLPW